MRSFKILSIIILDILIYFAITIMIDSNIIITPKGFSSLSLILTVYVIITLLPVRKGDGISISFIFIYCMVLFGRVILKYNMGYVPSSVVFDSFKVFSDESIGIALLLGIYSLLGLHIGILVKKMKIKSNNDGKELLNKDLDSMDTIDINSLKATAIIIFCIAIMPAILNYYNNFFGSTIIVTGSNSGTLIGLISGLMLPFFIILMVIKRKTWTFVLANLYYIPQLLWGGRGRPILQIAILIFIYFKYIHKDKVQLRNKLLYIIGSILLLNFFVVIREYRIYELSYWIGNFFSIFTETLIKTNPLYEIIYETGVGLAPTAATIELVPHIIPIQFGKTIFYSLTTAIPDFYGIRPNIMTLYGNIPGLVSSYYKASFGGTILQDFYVNFMWFTPFVMIIVGFVIQRYSQNIVFERSIPKTVFYSILLYPVLWWPRSSLGFMFRNVFVTLVIPIILFYFFKSYFKKYRRVKNGSN